MVKSFESERMKPNIKMIDGKYRCSNSTGIAGLLHGSRTIQYKQGLIGVGPTIPEAYEDWASWQAASDFVADIY